MFQVPMLFCFLGITAINKSKNTKNNKNNTTTNNIFTSNISIYTYVPTKTF